MGKKKSGDGGSSLFVSLATTGAVFGARKVLAVAWAKTTGKTAPTDPADRSVSIVEALCFAALAGIVGEVVRLLMARATTPAELPAAEAGAPEAS